MHVVDIGTTLCPGLPIILAGKDTPALIGTFMAIVI